MPKNNHFSDDMTNIGMMRHASFAKLPDSSNFFTIRHERLKFLSKTSPIKEYIDFLVIFTKAQQNVCNQFASKKYPIQKPPLNRLEMIEDNFFKECVVAFFTALLESGLSGQSLKVLENLCKDSGEWRLLAKNIIAKTMIAKTIVEKQIAEHIYIMGALQIFCTLHVSKFKDHEINPITHGIDNSKNICPACGGNHHATMVVGWQNLEGTRYCSCLYCGTLWHYVRIKCSLCGQTSAMRYSEIGDGPGTILAENCTKCQSYCKQLNQQKDSSFEAFADDIGSIALDVLMMQDNLFKRGVFNPFLVGC